MGSEKFRPRSEEENEHELTPQETENLSEAIDGYLTEQPEPLSEVDDGNIDDILARYMEKGAELSPDVKASLRKAIRRMLGIKLQKEE